MSSTNKTTNYNLSQFIGSDKPAWLVDYNGDMSAIDAQMKVNADAASAAQSKANTADGKADTNATAISTLDSQINGVSGIAADVAAVQGSVNTINSLIGNGEPTTTDKTLIGAINELDSDIGTANGKISGTLKTAERRSVTVAADNVKTYGEVIKAAIDAVVAEVAERGYSLYSPYDLFIQGVGTMAAETRWFGTTIDRINFTTIDCTADGVVARQVGYGNGSVFSVHSYINSTYASIKDDVMASGNVTITYLGIKANSYLGIKANS